MQDLSHPDRHNETAERPPTEDNTYMGYSVAPGRFSGNPSQGQWQPLARSVATPRKVSGNPSQGQWQPLARSVATPRKVRHLQYSVGFGDALTGFAK